MTRLADIVAFKRSQGVGVSSSLTSGIKERLKEKFDPRQLINQQGLLTALFPGLKAYSVKTAGSTIENSSIDVSDIKPIFEKIQYDTTLSAKNLSVLPSIHRDFNVIRQNVVKLLKLEKKDAATRADMFFKAAAKREEMYEAQLNKVKGESKKPTRIENDNSKNSEKFFKLIKSMLFFGGIAGILYFAFKEVSDAIEKLRQVDLKQSFLDFTDTLEKDLKSMIDSMLEKIKNVDVEDLERGVKDSIEKSKDTLQNREKEISDWWSDYYSGSKAQQDITNKKNQNNAPAPDNNLKGNKKGSTVPTILGHNEKFPTIGEDSTVELGSHSMPLEKGTISSYTGFRKKYNRMHYGIDIKVPVGSNVLATAAGTVSYSNLAGGYGNTVEIKHDDGTKTVYAHLSKILVAKGTRVTEGQLIGKSGGDPKDQPAAGGSEGPHLHYEIINKEGQAVEPAKVIRDLHPKYKKGKGLDVIRTTPLPPQSSRNLGSNLDTLSLSNYVDDLNHQTPLIIINDNKVIQQENVIISEKTDDKMILNMLSSHTILRSNKII